MAKIDVVLVALYRYRNIPMRMMHPLLENIDGIRPHTIFFKNCETNLFSYPTQKEEQLFIELIRKINPTIVGLSVLSPYVSIASRLTKLIKKNNPSTLVIWGGIHPTISPESCIDEADILCLGEGEDVMAELVVSLRDRKSWQCIKNLWIKDGGRIIKNPMRPLEQDLDSFPFASYGNSAYYFIESSMITQNDMVAFENNFWVQTSRGCPYSCSYCVNSLLHSLFKGLGFYTRRRSVDSVIKEIKKNNTEAEYIFFVDEVFGIEPSWLDEFQSRYKKEVGLPFFVSYNPRIITLDIIRKLVSAGVDMISFGIQSGSDFIRNEIFNRPGNNNLIIDLAKEIVNSGVKCKYDLIIDNPYDTEETLGDTIKLLLQLPKPLSFNLFTLQYFPNYPLTEKAIAGQYIKPEEASIDYLIQRTAKNWAFTPHFLPFTRKQILQNIIWLIAWNHANGNLVKYAVFGEGLGSKVSLMCLNFQSIIMGKILGVGGFVWRNNWIASVAKGISYIAKGDFKTFHERLGKRIKKQKANRLRTIVK